MKPPALLVRKVSPKDCGSPPPCRQVSCRRAHSDGAASVGLNDRNVNAEVLLVLHSGLSTDAVDDLEPRRRGTFGRGSGSRVVLTLPECGWGPLPHFAKDESPSALKSPPFAVARVGSFDITRNSWAWNRRIHLAATPQYGPKVKLTHHRGRPCVAARPQPVKLAPALATLRVRGNRRG